MTVVTPRYFMKNGQIKRLSSDKLFGAELRMHDTLQRYALIATHHVLVFVLKGQKIIHLPQEEILVQSGSYIFIPRGSYIFSDIHPCSSCSQRVVLFLDDNFLREMLSMLPAYDRKNAPIQPFFPLGEITPLLHHSLDSLLPFLHEELHNSDLLVKVKLQEIFLTLFENNSSLQQFLTSLLSTPKPDLRSFMEKHFTHPCTVREFAHLTCRSSRQFQRDFQEIFEETPQKWIRKRRLNYAYQLLHNSTITISEVCDKAGIQNYSHFIQLFKKEFGITPKQCMAQK